MNKAEIVDLAWQGAQLAYRAIMAARSRGDAEQIVRQLEAWGPAARVDLGPLEATARARIDEQHEAELERLRALRADEPTTQQRVVHPLDAGD